MTRAFIGGLVFVVGLIGAVWGTEVDSDALMVGGFAGMLVGYCVQGWTPPPSP